MVQPLPKEEGSQNTARGCAIFIVLIMLPLLGYFLWHAYQDLRCYTTYRPATCRILNKQLLENSGDDGSTYKPEIEFEFVTEDGRTVRTKGYDTWDVYSSGQDSQQALVDSFEVGKSYPCWYDPADPTRAVVARRISWLYLIALIPLLLLAGAAILLWQNCRGIGKGLSPEAKLFRQRASVADNASGEASAVKSGCGCLLFSLCFLAGAGAVYVLWPGTLWGLALALGIFGLIGAILSVLSLASGNRIVRIRAAGGMPSSAEERALALCARGEAPLKPIQTRPGEVLAVSLPQENASAPGIGCMVFSLLLMSASGVIFWQWASSLWGLALALGVIGLVGAIVTFFSLGSRKRIRPIQVETNAAELIPGQGLECFVSLTGQTELNSVTVKLVCEERVTYRQGTDTRTEKRKALEEILAEQPLVQLSLTEPLKLRGRTRIPAGAMHSFKSANNEIAWFIQVNCDIPRWPDSETRYPLRVAARWESGQMATKEADA